MASLRCCKPFENAKCSNKLKTVNESIRQKILYLHPTRDVDSLVNVCSSCYIKVATIKFNKTPKAAATEQVHDENSLKTIFSGSTPGEVTTKRRRRNADKPEKQKRAARGDIATEIQAVTISEETVAALSYYEELMVNIKFQFINGNPEDQQRLLMLLPKQMTHQEIRDYFGSDATTQLIDQCKAYQNENCIFASLFN